MKNEISNKLSALAIALSINGLLIGGVAYLFAGQTHAASPIVAVAQHSPSDTTHTTAGV
jgi:hypothetical protein